MKRYCFALSTSWTVAAVAAVIAALPGCEPDEPAMSGNILQGVNINVFHPYSAGGEEGHDDLIHECGWRRVYWKGRRAGEVKIEIDHSRLSIDGQTYGTVDPGDTVRIDMMKCVEVTVNGEIRRPSEPVKNGSVP